MYYGQNREDETINNLIVSKYGENFTGSILDLGANDGVTLSNSRFFVERGWMAVLVEAGSKPFSKLMLNTINDELCINCAIGRENGYLTFYESNNLLNTNDVGLVSSETETIFVNRISAIIVAGPHLPSTVAPTDF